ncbi:hypothetical protein L208DRAFT_1267987, partial [Tricholoma matsutake]
ANRGKNMAALIEEEALDIDGQLKKQSNPCRPCKRKQKQAKKTMQMTDDSDEDSNFLTSSSGEESTAKSGSDRADGVIPNDEIADMLPSKTAPITARTKTTTCSKKARKVTVEDVEDADSPRNVSVQNRAASPDPPAATETMTSNTEQQKKKMGGVKRSNLIYLFYELVPQNGSGQIGDPGDKHYRCCHGNRKILTVTKLMKSNLNGLYATIIGHLKHFPMMYRLYWVLKDWAEPPTAEEIGFASGKTVLDPKSDAEYLKKLEAATENIQKAFAMQEANAVGPWDQAKFECLLTEWIVACDQPFDEVEEEDARHPAPSMKLPGHEGICHWVMKMGEETVDGIHEMFAVGEIQWYNVLRAHHCIESQRENCSIS